MTVISQHAYAARVLAPGGDIVLSIDEDNPGDVTLDAAAIPHVQSSLTLAVEDAMLLEELDPRDSRRVVIEAKRADTTAPVYTAWVEQRRNQAVNPRPVSFGGSGWSAAAGLQGMAEPGWVGGTFTATTTPYIFSTTSARAYAAGEKVTLSIRYRVTGVAGAAQFIAVIPHVRTGNAYYRGQHVTRPIVVGQDEDVVIQWTTPVAIAANQLDLAVVGSAQSTGSGLATADAGFGMRATRALIEDGWTDGAFFDGASDPAGTLERTRWLGAANASASVIETRSIDRFDPVYGASRVFDLGIREATPNRGEGTVTLRLASDEALLADFAQLVDDTGAWSFFTSLRGIVTYVLGKIGAVLQPGTTDADLTPYWSVTNLMPNPALRGVVGNWVAGGANGTLSREAGHAAGSIPAGADVTTTTLTTWTGPSGLGVGGAVANTASLVPYATARPFTTYTISTWVYANVAKTLRLMCQVFGEDGAVLEGGLVLITQPVPANTWTRIVARIDTPPNASRLGPFIYPAADQQWVAGNTLRTTGWMLHEGWYPVPVPYFDGATPEDAKYTYPASGVAHASASSRLPKPGVERSPEALTMRAGISGMEFLHPLLQVAGLRLVCDERRRWSLLDDNYRADGSQAWRWGVNIKAADENLSREDDGWYDAAVYEYSWRDQNGVEQRRVDAFALVDPPTKVLRVELGDTPWPGPGRAEAIVRRAQGRGRTVTVSGVPIWDERPGQPLSMILEGTPIQTGIAQSVRFDLGEDTVTVSSRTTDTPAGAIDLLPGTINALTGTIDSL